MLKNDIHTKVKDTLDSVESINAVNVSPFFKDSVMHKIRNASQEDTLKTKIWFTPKLQLAVLVVFVVLNTMAFVSFTSSAYEDNINAFAETYDLGQKPKTSLFN